VLEIAKRLKRRKVKPGSVWYRHYIFENPFIKTISGNAVVEEVKGKYVLYHDEGFPDNKHSEHIDIFTEITRPVKAAPRDPEK
jgi:hypothetical protein